jgi:hypothetical protein
MQLYYHHARQPGIRYNMFMDVYIGTRTAPHVYLCHASTYAPSRSHSKSPPSESELESESSNNPPPGTFALVVRAVAVVTTAGSPNRFCDADTFVAPAVDFVLGFGEPNSPSSERRSSSPSSAKSFAELVSVAAAVVAAALSSPSSAKSPSTSLSLPTTSSCAGLLAGSKPSRRTSSPVYTTWMINQ